MPGMRMVVRNLGTTPVTIDRAGHQLGAGEYGVASDSDHLTAAALAAGKIGEVERPAEGSAPREVDPAAAAAFELLDAKDGGDSAQVAEATADLSAGNDGQPVDLTDGSSDAPDGAETSSAAEPAPAAAPAKTTSGRRGNR
jgi:hypothetical protein